MAAPLFIFFGTVSCAKVLEKKHFRLPTQEPLKELRKTMFKISESGNIHSKWQ
jgi:hypothetical protein